MAKKLTDVYEKNTSSDESKPEVKQTFVSGHWRTYGGEKKVKPEKTLEEKKIKEAKKSSTSITGLGEQKAPLKRMNILAAKIAKNTSVLPDMAKDINTMRTNLDKFLGAASADDGGFSLLDLLGLGDLIPDRERKRGRRKGKGTRRTGPKVGRRGIILGALGVGAVGAAGYAASEAYGEKSAESPERKKEKADKEAKKQEEIAAAVAATPQPLTTGEFDTGERPAEQDAAAQAAAQKTIEQVPTPPVATPVTPTPTEEAAPAKVETAKPFQLPELPRPTPAPAPRAEEPSIPKNVIRDEEGNALQSGSGGYVVSDTPRVTVTPVGTMPPARPVAPTPAPAAPAPTRPTPEATSTAGRVRPSPTPTAPTTGAGLKPVLARAESGNYNQLVFPKRGKTAPTTANLTDMTLNQVLAYQEQMRNSKNYPSDAVGKYQVIGSTLQGAITNLKLDGNQKFDQKTQDKIYEDYLIGGKRKGVMDYITGKTNNLLQAMLEMAQEFASFPVPFDLHRAANITRAGKVIWDERDVKKGESYYIGSGGNQAHVKLEQSAKALMEERAMRTGSLTAAAYGPYNEIGAKVAASSTQLFAMKNDMSRPQVIASAPAQSSGGLSSISAPSGSTTARPRTDHTQALVQRQTSGA